jgi:RNA polymerase sigma-70 factor (ECF subfamily)
MLERALAGDAVAAAWLYEHYRGRLKSLIELRMDRRLAGRIDASDVLQETMLEADRRLPDYAQAPGMDFYLWLRQLAVQKLIDLHRHHLEARKRSAKREISIQSPGADASSASLALQLMGKLTTPTEAARRVELRLKMQEALDGLEPVDREVLALRHFERLTNEQTAEVLGLSRSGASKRYIVALGRLRERLGAEMNAADWIT